MTDESTATLVAPEVDSGDQTEFPIPEDASPGLPEPLPRSLDRLPEPGLNPNPDHNHNHTGATPPHLRTAWKRKQDSTQPRPGKPSAKRALTRSSARPGTEGVRAHVPGMDGLPKPASIAPPAPEAPPAPTKSPGIPPPALRQTTPRAVVFYPSTHGVNPKAKPRRAGSGSGPQPPSGTILAGLRHGPRWPAIQKWIGTGLIVFGVLIALGAVGGNYLMQRHAESENAAFTASLSQFGPTPTPLTARATQVAARASVVSVSGGVAATTVPPRATAIGPLPTAGSMATSSAAPQATPGAMPPSPRPMGQGAPVVAGGGPAPIVAGGGMPGARPQTTPTPQSLNRGMPIAPPPIAPVLPPPQPTATPVPAADNPTMPAPDTGDQPMTTMEPEPAPTPEPAPKMPLPSHVTIPAIGVNSNVIEVGVSPTEIEDQQVYIWDVAAYAVGHHFSSASPGEGENVVFSGHDDWQGEVFRDLYKLKKGDKIMVQAGDKTWQYHVDTLLLLQEVGVPLEQRLNNALYIGATGDERLTLITCWPYGIDDHRIVVIAYPD